MRRLCAGVALVVGFTAAPIAVPATVASAAEPDVTAEGAVLWDPADDRVLWGKSASLRLRPASTTKIMTVLLALEAGTIDETVTVSRAAYEEGQSPGGATLGLQPGQTLPMRSLLAALLLRSGNDAAVAVAEHVAGSEAAFVEKMNARAAELGLDDTNFINSSGLTDDLEHRVSALDLARLAEVAMRNKTFAAWAAAPVLDIAPFGVLENRNLLLTRYEGANGVKTGYTALAGLCLVASVRRDGRTLYSVVLNSDDTTSDGSFNDTEAIFDHGFTDFSRVRIAAAGGELVAYRWAGDAVALEAEESLARTVAAGRSARWRVRLVPEAERPVPAGEQLGEAQLLVGGQVVDSSTLHAAEDVPAPPAAPPGAAAGSAVQDAVRGFARLYAAERKA